MLPASTLIKIEPGIMKAYSGTTTSAERVDERQLRRQPMLCMQARPGQLHPRQTATGNAASRPQSGNAGPGLTCRKMCDASSRAATCTA